jgi:hypothetical protein
MRLNDVTVASQWETRHRLLAAEHEPATRLVEGENRVRRVSSSGPRAGTANQDWQRPVMPCAELPGSSSWAHCSWVLTRICYPDSLECKGKTISILLAVISSHAKCATMANPRPKRRSASLATDGMHAAFSILLLTLSPLKNADPAAWPGLDPVLGSVLGRRLT